MTTALVISHITSDECIDFWHNGRNVPTSLTQEEWTDWIRYACQQHRNMAWQVAAMIEFGMDRWGESYYSLIEMTGYERGYVEKIEGWVRRGLIATRKFVLKTNPECDSLPHSWWESVGAIRDDRGRGWQDDGADRDQIMENRKSVILRGIKVGMDTPQFKAFCMEYRTIRAIPGEIPVRREKTDSKTVSDEFQLAADIEAGTPISSSVGIAEINDTISKAVASGAVPLFHLIALSPDHMQKVGAFRAYFGIKPEDYASDDHCAGATIERIIDTLYQIRKARLAKYEND